MVLAPNAGIEETGELVWFIFPQITVPEGITAFLGMTMIPSRIW